ncbi:MAG: winged helix-turn-helix transcriptional regulator [Candidatus Natronoplasma sp.]
MTGPSSITYKQKILLYLERFKSVERDVKTEKPEDITQKGIAENLNISRTHVSRIVKELTEEGYLKEKRAPVKGHQKRLKSYYLTSKGLQKVEDLLSDLSEIKVKIISDEQQEGCPLSEVEENTGGKIDLLSALSHLENSKEDIIDLDEIGPIQPITSTDDAPEVDELYGREEELKELKRWINEGTPVAAVLGRRGSGSSSLTSRFIEQIEGKHILWIDLKRTSAEALEESLSGFIEKVKSKKKDGFDIEGSFSGLLELDALLVFDDYHEVEDKIVHFLTELLQEFERKHKEDIPLKVMITGRIGTPFYQRFYQQEHVKRGIVKEIELSALDKEEAQKILGDEVQKEALERIMMFTRGSPLLLKLLKEGKEKELCDITPWEKEQISLLMYLKTETKE